MMHGQNNIKFICKWFNEIFRHKSYTKSQIKRW